MRKQFKDIDIYAGIKAQDGAKWIKDNGIVADWKTPEHIEVRPVYTKEDLEGMEHLDFTAGIPPSPRLYSWYPSLFAWSVFNDVPLQALDYPPVCWILHC